MNTNNIIEFRYLFDKLILSQLSTLNNIKLFSIEIESGIVNFSATEVINVSSPKDTILINFCGQNSIGKEIIVSFKFKGFSIFDELPATFDISSFTIDRGLEKKQKAVFSYGVLELVKEVGVYSLSFKNKEVEMHIDTSFYIEINNGVTFVFCNVHDRELNQFYSF